MRWNAFAWCAAAGAITWLVCETHSLAQFAGEQERAATAAKRQLAAAASAAVPSQKDVPRDVPPTSSPLPAAEPAPHGPAIAAETTDPITYAQLLLDLQTTRAQLAAVTSLLEQCQGAAQARAEQAAAAAERQNGPMPEGVRQCLASLQQLLRTQGFHGPRFLRAERVDGDGLHGVEMLDVDAQNLDVTFISAKTMTASLDRSAGTLELRFVTGVRTVAGQPTALPEDGHALLFRDVDGRAVEAALPYLVRASGAYTEPEPAKKRSTDVDASTRRQWLERFDRVLADAGTQPKWRVNRFRGMADGQFLQVELVGTDEQRHVVAGAHCERMAVEVDPVTATVSLRLQNGVLRRSGVESSISGEGYRMLLPKLTVKQATDAMFGMVVSK
jgi:hypothetical protein